MNSTLPHCSGTNLEFAISQFEDIADYVRREMDRIVRR